MVLMFHQVDNDMERWVDYNGSITLDSFEIFINELVNMGVDFGQVTEIGSTSMLKNKVYITFDDGYLDTYINAYPILKMYDIPFCIFITTGYVNKNNYLNKEMLKTLASEQLCTIGSHTISHPLLRFESEESSYYEIYKSKCILEECLGRAVEYFAFPYGSLYACSKRDIRNAQKAGYKLAFSTIKSCINDKNIKSKFFLPRININENNFMKLKVKL